MSDSHKSAEFLPRHNSRNVLGQFIGLRVSCGDLLSHMSAGCHAQRGEPPPVFEGDDALAVDGDNDDGCPRNDRP